MVNWTKAAIGFARGQGMTVEDIYFKEIGGVEYVYVKKFIKGRKQSLLAELQEIIKSLTFPKNMRWVIRTFVIFVQLNGLLPLYGQEIIPFSITNGETSNWSMGHRFLGGKVEFSNPSDYEDVLMKQNL